MNMKRVFLTFAFVGLAMMVGAQSTLVSGQVDVVVRVYPSEDIATFLTDLGLDEASVVYLSWNTSQIPWDVRNEIDTYITENRFDIESLVKDSLEDRLVPNDSRTAYMEIGSSRWFIYPADRS